MECQRMAEETDKDSVICTSLSAVIGMLSKVYDSILPTKPQKSTTTSHINKHCHIMTAWHIKPPIVQTMMESSEKLKQQLTFVLNWK